MKKENSKLPMILVVALPVLLLLATALADVTFTLFGQVFYASTFLIPLTYLVSCLISKQTESKHALSLVVVALVLQCLEFVILWIFIGSMPYDLMIATFLAFFLSQFFVLLIYELLKETKKDDFSAMLVVMICATMIETIIFYLFTERGTIFSSIFNVNVVVKLIYDIIFAKVLARKN